MTTESTDSASYSGEYTNAANKYTIVPAGSAKSAKIVSSHNWTLMQVVQSTTPLGRQIPLAIFFDSMAEQPTVVAVPLDGVIESGVDSAINKGAIEGEILRR